jgi:D-inositol-3-phosphate glycosyltransferase
VTAAPRRLLMIEQGGRGGVADYTTELVRALAPLGWTITLATASDHHYPTIDGVTPAPVFHYVRGDSKLGGAVRRHGLGKAVNGVRFLAALPRLVRLARRADVVHTQGWEIPQIGVVAVAALRLSGRPVIQTAHGTFERAERFLRTRRVVRELTARMLARTIVHTEADLARVPAGAAGRAVVIPHGEYGGLASSGGRAERAPARESLAIPPDAHVVLLFGQLRRDKGLADLLVAAARVAAVHVLIGGQDVGGLGEVAGELGSEELRGRVTVREGFLEMDEAARLFAAADTVALPYEAASQSGVLLLAYGFRRPVIVYPVGGLVEAVLDGETGWICARADAAALADTLAAAVAAGAEEAARRGENGARLANERFAWPAIARRTDALYREVLAGA